MLIADGLQEINQIINLKSQILCVLCILCGFHCYALDRNAFTFTHYDLKANIDLKTPSFAVEGKVTLRNDTQTLQRTAVLQISSTLAWKRIEVAGKPLQYVSQPYTSDVDHTGALSEAIVTLPVALTPGGTVTLEIEYEGAIPQDATRLLHIGVPANLAAHNDWDRISASWSAVRGIGYVAWYPVATDSVSLASGNEAFTTVESWKARQEKTNMRVNACISDPSLRLVANDRLDRKPGSAVTEPSGACRELRYEPLEFRVPVFAIANYQALERPSITVYHLPDDKGAAQAYALTEEKVVPFTTEWFGPPKAQVQVVEIPDPEAPAFESGPMLFAALKIVDPKVIEVAMVHQLTHASLWSPRQWIYEGLAHFAQALEREQQEGTKTAIAYMGNYLQQLQESEKPVNAPAAGSKPPPGDPLVNTTDEVFYRSKAMFVWWMLRNMVGDAALQRAFHNYREADDHEPSYMQRLLEAQVRPNEGSLPQDGAGAHKSLEWFFDDWVYRDRGLPDFKVFSAYPRQMLGGMTSVTVTIENAGGAGAEVAVSVTTGKGEIVAPKRVLVKAHDKAVTRVEVPGPPTAAYVNDGSVPESNIENNEFKIEAPK